ncbi:MAG: hypothetical protein AAGI06_14870, partial [Pseudomonadota bacterium]
VAVCIAMYRKLHRLEVVLLTSICASDANSPLESSEDYSSQLIDALLALDKPDEGVWARALGEYTKHINSV